MVRRIVALLLVLAPVVSLHAQSRYVADGAGAPVKWEGWGPRAIERAKKEKRPIFVVIGYASSFDCFRMQREAFLTGETARSTVEIRLQWLSWTASHRTSYEKLML